MAMEDAMEQDDSVVCLGVGITDPTGIFGTTKTVADRFPKRVIECPLSENTLTGACVGMGIGGLKPILVHARMDFLPLTMEHLINSAAKWEYMTGHPLTMVVRCIVGRGWGQGPTHSQNLAAMVAHIPGLRVFMPYRPVDAYYAIRQALGESQPTIIVESRRLYGTKGQAPNRLGAGGYWGYGHSWSYGPWTESRLASWPSRYDMQIVGIGDALVEANLAGEAMGANGYSVQVIDCQQYPLKYQHPLNERWDWLKATKRLVVVDNAPAFCGLSAEIVAMAAESTHRELRVIRVTPPSTPCPSAAHLEAEWYPSVAKVIAACQDVLGIPGTIPAMLEPQTMTVPSPF